jgi:twitching motility protein PilT
MNPDSQWLVRLGIDQGLFTRVECVRVRMRLGSNFSMVDFAQKLIDEEIVTDVDALERLAGQAAILGKKGAPPQDPMVDPEDLVEDRSQPAMARPPQAPARSDGLPPPPSFQEAKGKTPAPWGEQAAQGGRSQAPQSQAPTVSMDRLALLDDKGLGEELKKLLAGSVAFGASDLHLCTGRRPFVRKDRVIHFISEQVLEAE